MTLRYPVNYIAITQYYEKGVHNGLDLGWNSAFGGNNQPIYAAEDGVVVAVRKDYQTTDETGSSYGNYVKIRHNEYVSTLYAHMAYGSVTLNVGDIVKKGQQIGLMGNTGYSKGNHLHYEVFINDTKVNPVLYTYVYTGQIVSSNPDARQDLLYYEEPDEDIEVLKKMITELQDKNRLLEEEVKALKEDLKEAQAYDFTYQVNKTGIYQIKLYEDETLYIKN